MDDFGGLRPPGPAAPDRPAGPTLPLYLYSTGGHTKLRFFQMQGCGNVCSFIDCRGQSVPHPHLLARRVSNRHFGVGSDGLVLLLPAEGADLAMRIFNADGSEAEMCGNAIRCAARYAWDCGWVCHEPLRIQTAAGLRVLWNGPQKAVTVVMGRPSPLSGAGVRWQGEALTRLSVGNPHGVLFCPDIEHFPLAQAAAEIAKTARLNLEAVQVLKKNHLKMRVWERGSGETLACGTGACAAATAAVLKKHCERGQPITVEMPGGTVTVRWLTDGRLLLTGEAEFVFRGEWPEDPEPC